MKSKKMVLAVFLGLLASAAALISALFMLQQIKNLSTLPLEVSDLKKSIDAISVDVDVSPINKRIDDVVKHINELGSTVETIRTNQLEGEKPNTSTISTPSTNTAQDNSPVTQKPTTATPTPNTGVTNATEATTTYRLNLRSQPGLKSSIVTTTATGEKLTVMGDSFVKDGHTWIKVKDSKGRIGWVSKKYTN